MGKEPGKAKGQERPWDGVASPDQLALARGMVWRKMLESDEVQTHSEIAEREGLDSSYVSRLVNLTLRAAWVVEGILSSIGKAALSSRSQYSHLLFRIHSA